MITAKWLFENHLDHLALEKYLSSQLSSLQKAISNQEAEEIESLVLRSPLLRIRATSSNQGSVTEQVALKLQETREERANQRATEYAEALSFCKYLNELFDAILLIYGTQERWFVDQVYLQGRSVASLQSQPDSPYAQFDRSTIYRHHKRIIEKADRFINAYVPKEVSPCQLERYMSELKP